MLLHYILYHQLKNFYPNVSNKLQYTKSKKFPFSIQKNLVVVQRSNILHYPHNYFTGNVFGGIVAPETWDH